MEIPKIHIEQQPAKIDIEIQRAQIHMEMPQREMHVEWEKPQMEVTRTQGDVELDMEDFKDNLGLKDYDQLNSEAVSQAKAEAIAGVRDIVSKAGFIGDVTNPGPKVGQYARQELLTPEQPPGGGHSAVPPDIGMKGQPGKTEFQWTRGEMHIEWEGGGMPELYVEPPWSVEVELEQRAAVKVALDAESLPEPAGRNVNEHV